MTLLSAITIAVITVAPSDRMAMADRLFNRGAYKDARAEYAELLKNKELAEDELLYRFAECERALDRVDSARRTYGIILSKYPSSRHADRSRLMRALATQSTEEKVSELKLLDSDRVASDIRSAALYHIGVASGDESAFAKCIEISPNGKYAPYAKLRRAAALSASDDAKVRSSGVALFVEIADSGTPEFAEEALFMAANTSYRDKNYGEAASLLRRYMKSWPNGKHASDVRKTLAWCDYLQGRYADVISICGEGTTDDTAFLLASSYHLSGDADKAKRFFELYLEKYPQGRYRKDVDLPLARLSFTAAEKSGDLSKALDFARRAAAVSGLASDRLRVAWAYERCGISDEAEREYLAVATDFPGTPEAAEAMFRKALADLREERWSAADLALAEALGGKLDQRRRGEALYWRGVSAVRLDHAEEGSAFLKKAVDAGLGLDQSREARLLIADCDFNAGRIDDAKAAYKKLVREGAASRMSAAKTLSVGKLLFPSEESAICARALAKGEAAEWRQAGYALLGSVEEEAKSFAAAIEAYRKCLAEPCRTEDLPRAASRLGALEVANADWDAAESTLKRSVELNTDNVAARAEAYYHLAEVSVAKKDMKSAKAYATVVVTLFENTPWADKAEAILKTLPEEAAS